MLHLSPRIFPALLSALLACNGGADETTTEPDATTSTATDPPTSSTTDTPTSSGGPLCGNGALDDGEDCDGAELGGKACGDVDPATPLGALACTGGCTYDTSACMAAGGEFVALNEVTSQGASVGPYAGLGDAIELYNPGAAAVDLSGWKLSDDPAFPPEKTYVFPNGTTIDPAAFLVLVTYDEIEMTGDFPFGLSGSNEETVTLASPDGTQIDQVIFAGGVAEVSYCRLPDGEGAWQQCDSSLGGPNLAASMVCGNGTREGDEPCEGDDLDGATCQSLGFTGGTLACTEFCVFDTGLCDSESEVVLNEIESTEDHIEIFNSSAMPVDISGWILTDDPAGPNYDPAMDPERLEFEPGSMLPAGAYLDVAKGDLPGQHVFGLSANGDTVTLLRADLSLADQITYGDNQAAVSFCRIPDGPGNPWLADCIPTFGAANDHP